eukprot:1158802-Pelagomonas_calceolata.AAC.7
MRTESLTGFKACEHESSAARVDTASSEDLVDAEGDDGLQQAVQQGLEAGRCSIKELVQKEKRLNEEVAVQRAQAELDSDGPVLQSSNTKQNPLQAKVTPQDFEMLRVVGQGAFGKVRPASRQPGSLKELECLHTSD